MKLTINGTAAELPDEHTIASLLESRGLKPSRVVVELNGEIADSAKWTITTLREHDRIELISFVGGG